MRVIITTVQVPFIRGGAELHAEGLLGALIAAGHEAEIVAVPFKWYPPQCVLDHMLACRLFDLTEVAGTRVDLVIGLRFPAYLIPHPNKVLWILHQHRAAYELWDHSSLSDLIHYPDGVVVRDAIRQADRSLIPEARAVFANSRNVARRLKEFCGISAQPLYHPPPNAEKFYNAAAHDFFFFPSRICIPKRQELILRALKKTRQPVRVRFVGSPDRAAYGDEMKRMSRKLKVSDRVEWLAQASDAELLDQYAHCLGVIYPPIDEDYGYVTLEAMLAKKPVVTCTDSGGPLEFVQHESTGLIVEPCEDAVAEALDRIWSDRQLGQRWGEAGRDAYESLGLSWARVVKELTA
jgi:glycosyltransferase involved in cell wall biosynthesis